MRKIFMIVAMMLVPALASAWTLPVKVTNNSAGIALLNKATVTVGLSAPVDITVGTKTFYPATADSATVALTNTANLESVILDGVDKTAATVTAGSITVSKGTASSHVLNIVYKTTTAPANTVSVTQTPGGLTSLKIGSATNATMFTGVLVNQAITATFKPNIGYQLTSYSVTGGATISATSLSSAVPVTIIIPSVNASTTVTAVYAASGAIAANAAFAATGLTSQIFKVTASASTTSTKAITYTYDTNCPTGDAHPVTNSASTWTFTPNAISDACFVSVQVIAAEDTPISSAVNSRTIKILNGTTSANNACLGCHTNSTPVVIANYNTAYASPGTTTCVTCHNGSIHNDTAQVTTLSGTTQHPKYDTANIRSCTACHTSTAVGSGKAYDPLKPNDVHAKSLTTQEGCVDCHVAGMNAGAAFADTYVNDNNGVRAIVGEFAKRSHHVTGVTLNNTHCAVCHLEGKKVGTAVVVDQAYHMVDNKIYLRNGNVGLIAGAGAAFAWQPSAPNHTLMDNFCFSCHNAAGAPTAAAALGGVTGYSGTALNPFDDTVSNSYDQVSRVNVVGVYEQFDTGNSSHHAVRGKKYTASTLVGSTAVFTQISTANAAFGKPLATSKTATSDWTAAPITGIKATIGTIKDLNKFTATYLTLDGTILADNITIHCGDCHTVGQFRAADVGVKPFNSEVIGAHGSGNEYMLRNANGNDTLAKDALVCYICHAQATYDGGRHDGVVDTGPECNGVDNNGAGKNGLARIISEAGVTTTDLTDEVAAGGYGGAGGSNIFGIKCANCHNASDSKTFGGIHGNAGNASYQTYSGAKLHATDATTVVSRKPYRFMPGLGNFRYNGGDNVNAWTVKTVSSYNKQSCYTLNGDKTKLSRTAAELAGANINATTQGKTAGDVAVTDNGLLGSWGACTDHAGTSVQGGMHDPARNILRPLTY